MSLPRKGWNRTFCFPNSLHRPPHSLLLLLCFETTPCPKGGWSFEFVCLFLLLSLESLFPLLTVSGINCSLAEKEARWQWRVSISSSCSCWPERASQTMHLLTGEEAAWAPEVKWINSLNHLSKRRQRPGMPSSKWAHLMKTGFPRACTDIMQHNSLCLDTNMERLTPLLIDQTFCTFLGKSWWHTEESISFRLKDNKVKRKRIQALYWFYGQYFSSI